LKFEILNFIPRKQIHGKGCQEQIRSEYVNEELQSHKQFLQIGKPEATGK
jgi:hypothetical protein